MERIRELLNTSYLHKRGYTGKGITVAVMDTGLFCHKDFAGRVMGFYDVINGEKECYDDNGHGTHVAGIIGSSGCAGMGQYMGMAPGCNLLPIKVLDRKGGGNTDQVKEAIEWLLSQKEKYRVRILNISVGMLKNAGEEEQVELIKLVEDVWDAGIVVVAAAGNNGPAENSVTIPGICRSIITVGSSDDKEQIVRGQGLRRGYSGRGPTDSCVMKPEILAPGTQIISCDMKENGYTTKSGTSMATPVVAGAIALLLSKYPWMTPKDVKLKLYHTADRSCDSKWLHVWGCLDLVKLLK
ncbi:MAG: S8 family peptidase [Lachnospiraceae bacterium]|nr:S8 family peptidase [Lachnospiraceae bacterium]